MRVLMSIKPEYAEKIFSGEKKYEFRRAIFQRNDVDTIIVYASSPIQRVVGEFHIGGILMMTPQELWKSTQSSSGISKSGFDAYFEGKYVGYAIQIGRVKQYENQLFLSEFGKKYPPQSFCYVEDGYPVLKPYRQISHEEMLEDMRRFGEELNQSREKSESFLKSIGILSEDGKPQNLIHD